MAMWRICIARCIPKAIHSHKLRICNTYMLFHYKNGYTNAPQCYVTRTLSCVVCKNDSEICQYRGADKLQRQKILSFIYPIYNHNWRNISTIYIYNKTNIKRNILTIKKRTSGSRSG